MFLNKADDQNVEELLKLLSSSVKLYKDQNFRAFVYFLDGNEAQIKALNKKLKTDNISLSLITDEERKSTLKGYKINSKAKSTIMLYVTRQVKSRMVNFEKGAKDENALKKAIKDLCS